MAPIVRPAMLLIKQRPVLKYETIVTFWDLIIEGACVLPIICQAGYPEKTEKLSENQLDLWGNVISTRK